MLTAPPEPTGVKKKGKQGERKRGTEMMENEERRLAI